MPLHHRDPLPAPQDIADSADEVSILATFTATVSNVPASAATASPSPEATPTSEATPTPEATPDATATPQADAPPGYYALALACAVAMYVVIVAAIAPIWSLHHSMQVRHHPAGC